jgi:hypothetical protein
MTRLIQLQKGKLRRVARVEGERLRVIECSSVYELALAALAIGNKLSEIAQQRATQELLDYGPIYAGTSEWRVLPAIDHPTEPACCLVSGTGLTHLGSARERQAMHAAAPAELTDSMKMFRWGVEGGRPGPGAIGVSPEWFYKGCGTVLRGHGEPIDVPAYADDGGEEGEIAGVYLVGHTGQPYRLGLAVGNEHSDHVFEKKNYLYLAGSKLRSCALGPELWVDPEFESVEGQVLIERNGAVLWSKTVRTGNREMCHSLENIEHHHFKIEGHRRPGDVHVHFLGADCLSFGEGVRLADGDVMQVSFAGFGRPLRNPLRVAKSKPARVHVLALE